LFSSSEADVDVLEQPDHGTAGYISGKLESCSKIDDFVVAVDSGH